MNAAAHADRYPAELKPNPDYEYSPPRKVMVGNKPCIEVDAGVLRWATDMAEPRPQRRGGKDR